MKMAGINFYAPVPRVRSESLPACPRPRDNGESLVRIDGLDARIRYAASYRAAGIACAPQGCWVREGVVPLLQQALGLLPEDYSLLIFDAYRPLAVQQALYEEYSALVRRSHPEYTPEQLAAAKSILGLMSLDYTHPVMLVSENEKELQRVYEAIS